jgi:GAF domain-containing protein
LRSRGEVIGALTVQSDVSAVFDTETVTILLIMADQVAVALDNARLYAESQETLETLRQAYSGARSKSWRQTLAARANWGYVYNGRVVQPVNSAWQPEMLQAVRTSQPVVSTSAERAGAERPDLERPTQGLARLEEGGRLALPIRVRNQTIGVFSFRKRREPGGAANQETWTAQEISTLEALLTQVGEALESARLYEETQQKAEQERMVGEITAQMRATLDIETVLRTAVDQIYEAMGLKEMSVWLSPTLTPLEPEPDGPLGASEPPAVAMVDASLERK